MSDIAAAKSANIYAGYVNNRRYIFLALPVAVGAFGVLLQFQTYLNHDVAWVLYSAQWLVDGGKFGRDIIAPNPPLIWWLSEIPVMAARETGLSPILAFRLFISLIIIGSLAVSDCLLAAAGASKIQRGSFLACGAYFLTIGANRDFGQREFLTATLILPYLMAVVLRLQGGRVSSHWGLLFGAAAAFGIAFKPYFIVIPILVEVFLCTRLKSTRPLWRPEAMGALIAGTACLLAVWVYARPWVNDAAPDIARIYWAFSNPSSELLILLGPKALLTVAGAYVIWRASSSDAAKVLALAAIGFLVAALCQTKGYSYQIYPAIACIALSLSIGIQAMLPRIQTVAATVLIVILSHNLYVSATSFYFRSELGGFGKNIGAVLDLVRQRVPVDGSFLAVSTHPYPGFPTALYAQRRWASPSADRLFLPAVVQLRAAGSSADAATLNFAERKSREAILRNLERRPALVLFDIRATRHAIGENPFDFLGYYREDPAFRDAWSAYQKLDGAPQGFAAYVRKREGT